MKLLLSTFREYSPSMAKLLLSQEAVEGLAFMQHRGTLQLIKARRVQLTLAMIRLLQAGCSQVFITSRHPSDCDKAVAGLNALPNKYPNAKAIAVPTDCSRADEIDRLVSVISQSTDHVDIVFANAGTVRMGPLEEHSEKEFSDVIDLNVNGTILLVQK